MKDEFPSERRQFDLLSVSSGRVTDCARITSNPELSVSTDAIRH
jgi:hypothetical protein